jgi:hypothetical protein
MCQHAGPLDTWITLQHDQDGQRPVSAEVCSPLSEAVYVLTAPAEDTACCSCAQGIQGITCKHHIVVLQYIHTGTEQTTSVKRSFENLLVDKLGTNFARPTGCQPGVNGLAALNEVLQARSSAVAVSSAPVASADPVMEPAVAVDDSLDSPRSPVRVPTPDAARPLLMTPSKYFATCTQLDAAASLCVPEVQQVAQTLPSPARRFFVGSISAHMRKTLGEMNTFAADSQRDAGVMDQTTPSLGPASYTQQRSRALSAPERCAKRNKHAAQPCQTAELSQSGAPPQLPLPPRLIQVSDAQPLLQRPVSPSLQPSQPAHSSRIWHASQSTQRYDSFEQSELFEPMLPPEALYSRIYSQPLYPDCLPHDAAHQNSGLLWPSQSTASIQHSQLAGACQGSGQLQSLQQSTQYPQSRFSHPPELSQACTFEQSQTLQTAHPLQPSPLSASVAHEVADSHPRSSAAPVVLRATAATAAARARTKPRSFKDRLDKKTSHWPEQAAPTAQLSAPVASQCEPSTLELPSFLTQQQSTLTRPLLTPSYAPSSLGSMRTAAAATGPNAVPGQPHTVQFSARGPLLQPLAQSARAAPGPVLSTAQPTSFQLARQQNQSVAEMRTDIEGFLASLLKDT